ncbi:MAG: hypothetical protein ABMA01_03050, partial [Chthoniobacteraceae bacterium]
MKKNQPPITTFCRPAGAELLPKALKAVFCPAVCGSKLAATPPASLGPPARWCKVPVTDVKLLPGELAVSAPVLANISRNSSAIA